MWASWAFCKLVHIPMPTPYLSIKKFKSSTDSHHIAGQRATRQFGDEMQEYSTNHSNLLLIEQFFRFSTLSQPRLARDAKSQFFRDVTDNLNTHTPGSLYEAFPPEQAKALWDRFEFVYTPKHGSWLNMAEIEINVMVGVVEFEVETQDVFDLTHSDPSGVGQVGSSKS